MVTSSGYELSQKGRGPLNYRWGKEFGRLGGAATPPHRKESDEVVTSWVRCSRYVLLEGGHAGEVACLGWPGNILVSFVPSKGISSALSG